MPKESLRDKLDGNELDLSLSELETVPVRELAVLPKATHLDLSCNKLAALPPDFSTLTHIIKLDLSKNALTELPKDFGNLSNLQHLDLLGNKLTTLPRSFSHLKRLKWLDLKDNPLEGGLKKNAGDCLDEVECRKCAIRILMYMKDLDSQLERQWQNKLKKQREEEAQQKEAEEKERQKKRQEKKAEKERRRRELEAKRTQERLAQNGDTSDEEVKADKEKLKQTNHRVVKKNKGPRGGHCFLLVFFSFLVLVVALLVALELHCASSSKDQLCALYWQPARTEVVSFASYSKSSILKVYNQNIRPLFS